MRYNGHNMSLIGNTLAGMRRRGISQFTSAQFTSEVLSLAEFARWHLIPTNRELFNFLTSHARILRVQHMSRGRPSIWRMLP